MKTIINTSDFQKVIKILNKIPDSKTTSVFDNVLVSANKFNGGIAFTKTNLSQIIHISIPMYEANIEESGTTVIPLKTIDIMSKIKEDNIIITDSNILTEKKNIVYNSENIEMYNNQIINPETNLEFFQITEKELFKLLEVKFCLSISDERKESQKLCINGNDFVGCDGYRLSIRKGNFESKLDKLLVEPDVIETLCKILDKNSNNIVKVYGQSFNNKENKNIKFVIKRNDCFIELIGKTFDGKYLDYRNIVSVNGINEYKTKIEVNLKELINELEFINEAIKDCTKVPLKFKIINDKHDCKLSMLGEIVEYIFNEAKSTKEVKIVGKRKKKEELIYTYKHYDTKVLNQINSNINVLLTGEYQEEYIGVNIRYILETLKLLHKEGSETVNIKIDNNVSPIVITDVNNYNYDDLDIVLPVRIKN